VRKKPLMSRIWLLCVAYDDLSQNSGEIFIAKNQIQRKT
jgi:hypothetical protein